MSEQFRKKRGAKRIPETALIMENYKLIKQFATNTYALFTLREDPMEHNNVIDSAPNAVELIEKMDSLIQANASVYDGIETKQTTLDDETTQQLKALGYIE